MRSFGDQTRRAALLGLVAFACAPATALGQRRQRREERRERRQQNRGSDSVREAVRRGEIEPLRRLMRYFERRTNAEVIDVQYSYRGGQHLYGFKFRTRAGRLRWAVINAATREIMTRAEARQRYGG